MRCHDVKSWTFSGLVAAFLDLSVAFSLLCASSLVYLTSKLLGVFGLNLPCPCDGLFSDPPHKNKCFQETLVNLPVKKISSVQRSVISTTPFDSLLYKEADGESLGKKRKGERSRHVDFEKEVVFSTPEVENASCFDLLTSQSLKKGSFKVKSKRLSFHRSPYGCQSKHSPQSPASVMEYLNDAEENHPLLVNSKDGGKDLEDVPLKKSVSLCSIGCEDGGAGNKQPERTLSWAGEGTSTSPVDLTQKPIEQVLAEERASHAALALELEKERNAAATAADEALSMILRLQEEKASIEMEARQYQRMIEEKSAFDAEEMSILKEILLRREWEKHFLEKEVDTYRQMFLETEQPLPNTPDSKQPTESLDDSSGFEMFTNQMDSRILDYENVDSPKPGEVANDGEMKVNEVDRDPEIVIEQQEGEESTLLSEPVAESTKVGEDSDDIDCCCVHDIHVVKDEDNKVQLNVPSDHVVRDLKLDRSQSVLGTSYGLPPACPQGRRIVSPNMRRNSMSAVDYERLKIESEVGLLRGRLRAVQKGRENISFSSKEQSKSVLGDKTSRFWEARRSEPIDSSSPSSTMVKAMSMSLDLHSA
ncbi:PREDICTED: uncharacterized protein LOC106337325 [Brassica oleracea var. oleracea]|uniref:GTD-binding domain-containing protein n=1 Tax=Brassica oleracea var. oleracea TaxID=109376 RepID=A0A0D3BYY3_BRAOL|nr:PREDICTED: uncharacterized protein LOC106337325 [Brassica oleracea var. oleracea]XP_013631874.1 PREDICTED: uncharacterized protein LOC106337325 [Brassica oleracea var. oleracea]